MNRPEEPFEAASYDLNKFRERRMADRRFSPRDSADRRAPSAVSDPEEGNANPEPGQGAAEN